ncbi:MAG: hypothetical protein KJN76_11280 [Eudoraea sp.]|nr:hypothetical protein [Eudoraea sp.]
MAGGGFASHAMNVIKANRALLKKRKRLSKTDYITRTTTTKIKIKETTPGQMRAVQLKLAAGKRLEIKIWVISVLLTAIVLTGLYYWLSA